MTRLLWRQNLRWLLRSPWQVLVPVLGVALGVAAVVAIDLAKASALESMRASGESFAGRATHVLRGGPTGIDEALYRTLRIDRGLRAIAPVVTGPIQVGGRSLVVLGIDPFADATVRPQLAVASSPSSGLGGALLTRPGGVLLSRHTAAELGLRSGDRIEALGIGRRQPIEVIGELELRDVLSEQALRDVAVCDIATAQELLQTTGRLTRIDLVLPATFEASGVLETLRASLPAGTHLEPASERVESIEKMTHAFRTNLTALSMLGLLVGMLLIYNALTFSVVQRRSLFGRLKAIGVTRGEIFGLVLGEGAVIGLTGALIGLALGVFLARVLLAAVSQTMSDIYQQSAAAEVQISMLPLAVGLMLGIGASLLAALLPALEATASPAVQVLARSNLEGRARARIPWLALLGFGFLLAGAGLTGVATRSLIAGLAVIALVVIGFALMIPGATVLAIAGLRPLLARFVGPLGTMACRGVTGSLSRTGVALSALAVAISVTIGIDIMVGSFRNSVDRWLARALDADIYVRYPDSVAAGGPQTPLHPDLLAIYSQIEGVAKLGSNRTVALQSPRGVVDLAALGIDEEDFEGSPFMLGDPKLAWPRFRQGEGVLISEPLAHRFELALGESIALRTDAGLHDFAIVGIVRSYSSDRGVVLMHRAGYDLHWNDPAINAISIDVAAGEQVDEVIRRLHAVTPEDAVVRIQSNRVIREASLQVFDRTFAITQTLRGIALLVAFAGVIGALLALALERRREIAILRATGMLPRQVAALVLIQTGLLGLLAGVLALPIGLVIAWLLVHVVNRRSFGWSVDFVVSATPLFEAVAIALVAALLAGLHPAWTMARMKTAEALREE